MSIYVIEFYINHLLFVAEAKNDPDWHDECLVEVSLQKSLSSY